jgi:DNA invertase Pin-like site-specific DNA recombinase
MEIHLNRKAIIYIRQSSEKQVREHIESGKLQYALKDRVSSLGWQDVMIVDEDQGKSGAFYSERSGFQRVVALVGMGEVGIVMSLEATRMARNNRDWGHLIDLCSILK